MHGKIRFSRWFIAAAVLAIAECASVASIEAAAARVQSSDDHFRYSRAHPRSDKFFQNLFEPLNWRQQRKPHQPSDSSRAPHHKTKWKPKQSEPTTSEKPGAQTTVENVPLPRPRPPPWAEPHSFVEAAGPDFDTADVTSAPSDCNQRLNAIAAIELLPRLIGPGDCGGRDMIELNAALLPNRRRIEVKPAAVLRCEMAESFAAWLRDEASADITTLGAALRGVGMCTSRRRLLELQACMSHCQFHDLSFPKIVSGRIDDAVRPLSDSPFHLRSLLAPTSQ
jgi:hypothetical protein